MKRTFLLGTLVMLLALCVNGVALGGSSYQTSLSIGYSPGGSFAGKLRSHAGCVGGRKVVVYRKGPRSDRSIGNDTAAASGRWSVAASKPAAGDYYAKTSGLTLNSGGKCASAKSVSTHVS
jgi:hypothetical protein